MLQEENKELVFFFFYLKKRSWREAGCQIEGKPAFMYTKANKFTDGLSFSFFQNQMFVWV